jgi:hypothetical protein
MRIDAGLDTEICCWAPRLQSILTSAIETGSRRRDGADLVETLARIETIVPQKQDASQATYAPILGRKMDGSTGAGGLAATIA